MASDRQSNEGTVLPEPRSGETLAATAAERVRSILEAAEASAAEIRRDAEAEAGEHVRRVAEATSAMLARVDAMQAELDALVQSLRTVRSVAGAPSAVVPSPEPEPAAPEPTPESASPEQPAAAEPGAPAGATRHPSAPFANGDADEDLEGARLIALNMALNGTPREETAHYLGANFSLRDADGLLDEVYASVED